jgi:hypothetical protein
MTHEILKWNFENIFHFVPLFLVFFWRTKREATTFVRSFPSISFFFALFCLKKIEFCLSSCLKTESTAESTLAQVPSTSYRRHDIGHQNTFLAQVFQSVANTCTIGEVFSTKTYEIVLKLLNY